MCVLDFNRLGDDERMDWLERGLADMVITALNHLAPYEVIQRRRLAEILREHRLAASGTVDTGAAIRRAQIAKADMLVLGNFVPRGEAVTVEVRLIRTRPELGLNLDPVSF